MRKSLEFQKVVKVDVTCEACNTDYYFPMEVKISEDFNTETEGDEEAARERLDKKFSQVVTEDGIVRCPSCAHLNNSMYRARTQAFKTEFWLGLIGVPICVGVFLGVMWIVSQSGSLFYVIAIGAALGAVVLSCLWISSILGLLGIWDFKTKKNGIIPGTEGETKGRQRELLVKLQRGE